MEYFDDAKGLPEKAITRFAPAPPQQGSMNMAPVRSEEL
jgi:hypothetical protein